MTSTHPVDDHPKFPSDRSERAKAMVAAGLLGGAGRGQGRKPKASTATGSVADLAAQEAPAIKRAYSDALRSKNERTRLVAADRLLRAERDERADQARRADSAEAWLPSEAELQELSGTDLDAVLDLACSRFSTDLLIAAFLDVLAPGAIDAGAFIDSTAAVAELASGAE